MTSQIRTLCLFALLVLTSHVAFAQPGCPNIDVGPDLSVDCNTTCVDLSATVLETGATTSYAVSSVPFAPPAPFTGGTAQFINTDDIWGDVINLPFNFCFYGNVYSSLVIGANGLLSFDVTLAGNFCQWSFTDAIPSANLYTNAIFGAYHDIDPSVEGEISYFIQGSAPCRMFIVSFANVAHFDCDCSIFGSGCRHTTQQIVLYETTNVIEVYIQQKETCSSWNNGNAVIGIQDATGAAGVTPPGRNTGNWSANNEGWRFTPDGAPNFEVNWYDGGTLVGSGLTLNVCPSATTTYDGEVVYTNCDGAVVTVTDQVTVAQNSTVSVSVNPASVDICAGQSTTLTASSPNPGMNYTWSPATGLSATTGATVDASPNTTTLYTVTGNDGTCSASANANVNVVDIQLVGSSTDASCAGNDGTATITPSGGVAPYSYAWNTTPVQTTQTATGLAAGTYDVGVSDATGCTATETVTVTLTLGALSPPTMTATDAVCTANNGTATATPVDGNAPFTYSWDTSPVQTTQTATGLAPGSYTVTLTDAGGCTSNASIVVGADPGNVSASITTFSDVACNGNCDGSATVDVMNGAAPITYLWDDPSNQTTQTASNLCAGTYNVGIADANGCLATAQIVISEPTAIVASAVMDQQSNCGNPDGVATVSANGGTVANNYSYNWSTTPPQFTSTATGLSPITYTVLVLDDNGCTASTTVDITSTPGFTASITSSSNTSCFSQCDGEATAQESPAATQPVSYAWTTSPVQNTATATGLCAGNYEVTITDDDGCIATAQITISEPIKLSAVASTSDNQICIGESADLSVTLSGGTQPYASYAWTADPADPSLVTSSQNPTVSPLVTTEYTVAGTDANGCVSEIAIVNVEVNPGLSLDVIRPIASPDTGICPYDFAVIDLLATGGDGNYTFYLEPDNVNPVSLPMMVQPSSTTTYNFTVVDGCTTPPANATSTITVYELPIVDFIGDDLNGCDVHSVVFTDNTSPTPVAWNWNFGDSNATINSSTTQNPAHEFSGAGLYTISLEVESADGCINDSSKTDYVEVYPLPYANFEMDPEVTTVLEGHIDFTDLSAGEIADWTWDFGTGDGSVEQNPFYNYTDTGTFLVWLRVTTIHGCEDIARRQVVIEPNFMFYVPNTFTPNNDGRNDYFRGYGEGVDWDTYQLSIYNRWGEEIFYTADIDLPWDGKFEGADVPNEVYVWKILITDLAGDSHTYRGHVTVLR